VERFGDSLLFLQKTEGLLRRYLIRAWRDVYGESWVQRVLELAADNEHFQAANMKNPSNWSLAELLRLAGLCVSRDRTFAEHAQGATGERVGVLSGWLATLERVTSIRNATAHGRIYELQDLSEYYPTIDGRPTKSGIQDILGAAGVYLELVDIGV
jgi:hypothetical protein